MMFEVYRCGRSRRYPPLRPKCVKQVLNTALWDQHVLAASGAREPGNASLEHRDPQGAPATNDGGQQPRRKNDTKSFGEGAHRQQEAAANSRTIAGENCRKESTHIIQDV